MKALVYNGPRDVQVKTMPDAKIGRANVKAYNRKLSNLIEAGKAKPSWC